MITELYVDMDGVLADFYNRFIELFKQHPERDYPSNNQAKKDYQNKWHKFIKDDHFATLDPMPDLQIGLLFLNEKAKHMPVNILGSTARAEFLNELTRQKTIWLRRYDINFNTIFVPGKSLKQHYAKPGRVLIDDTQINITQWNDNGGIGILHTSWDDTIVQINNLL